MALSTPRSPQRDRLFAVLLRSRGEDDRFGDLLRLRHDLRLPQALMALAGPKDVLAGLGRAVRAQVTRSVLISAIEDSPPHVVVVVGVESPAVLTFAGSVAAQEAGARRAIVCPQPPVTGPRALRASYARAVLNVALALQAGLPGPVIEARDLVLPRVFGQLDAEEQAVLLRPLGALLALPPQHRDAYVQTLDALRGVVHPRDAAPLLHLHENTIRYRIERIEEMTGVSLKRPDQRQALDIAVMLHLFLRGAASASAGSRS